jgi:serine protease AprX
MRLRTAFLQCVFLLSLVAGVPRVAPAQSASSSAANDSLVEPIPGLPQVPPAALAKLGPVARTRAGHSGRSRVIVQFADGASPSSSLQLVQLLGGTVKRTLPLANAHAIDLPNGALATLANESAVARITVDRRVAGAMERTGATTGAAAVRADLGFDGAGVGIAVIDSGVSSWHDDLAAAGGGQRVDRFVDLVDGFETPYDDYGHGTHVAGIIAGNGFDSNGARTGIAPGARLVVLKVLDDEGRGYVSDVIAALDYAVAHKDALNIRVVNLSIATPVYESYHTDPLTLAAKRAVDAGIVVVAAAGNRGRNPDGHEAYGGITAPGNAPWVLTVGASSHMGTAARADDTMAVFSSRGPTAGDISAKPDLVAPGVGIESLSDPGSVYYQSRAPYLLSGTVPTGYLPYLSLSGTSMAAPVVSGAIALMLQANPALTPNAVKAILQFTSETYAAYDPLTAGAGFLNAAGAVALARYFVDPSAPDPVSSSWSRRLIWGNHLSSGGRLMPDANAWLPGVQWGAATAPGGNAIQWGSICPGSNCDAPDAWVAWGPGQGTSVNVVWGMTCDGLDCLGLWTWSGAIDESVVWGTSEAETVVWGMSDTEESVVWGTTCSDSACEPVIWNRP